MKRRYPFAAWLLAGCLALSGGIHPATAPARAEGAWRHVPLGLCEDYPEETRSLAEVERDLALLAAAGISVLRVSIGWDDVEPANDRFDFRFWDQVVALADERHVRLLPYVAYAPRWAGDGRGPDHWRRPPRDPRDFADVMEHLAGRYRGRIHSWELWNEPDNADYWRGSVAQYAELLRLGSAAVRRGDPGAQIVSGGLAGKVEFLRALFAEPGVARAVDVVNLHAYYETWNPEPIERLPAYVEEAAAAIAPARLPFWLAEVGYSTHRQGAQVSPYVRASHAYEHTLPFAGVVLVRTFALALASPRLSLVAWYEVKDLDARAEVIGDVNNRHLGVAFPDHRPKPALGALTFVSRLFAPGFRPLEGLSVRPETSGVEARAFQLPSGAAVLLAWLPTHPTGAPAPDTPAGDAPDRRRVHLEVRWPCAQRLVRLQDEQGHPLGTEPLGPDGRGAIEVAAGTVVVATVDGCTPTLPAPRVSSGYANGDHDRGRGAARAGAMGEAAGPRPGP
jgi:hypothetical protein